MWTSQAARSDLTKTCNATMKRILFILPVLALLLAGTLHSCKPSQQGTANDSIAVTADSLPLQADGVEVAPDDKWTEEYIAHWVEQVYQKVNKVWSQKEVHQEELDTAFFAKSYLELKEKVLKAQENLVEGNPFFIEYMPFSQGLRVPIKVSNIKPEILTGNIAEVTFDISDNDGEKVSMWWHLDFADNEWRIDDYKNDPDDHYGMADKMYNYIQEN